MAIKQRSKHGKGKFSAKSKNITNSSFTLIKDQLEIKVFLTAEQRTERSKLRKFYRNLERLKTSTGLEWSEERSLGEKLFIHLEDVTWNTKIKIVYCIFAV